MPNANVSGDFFDGLPISVDSGESLHVGHGLGDQFLSFGAASQFDATLSDFLGDGVHADSLFASDGSNCFAGKVSLDEIVDVRKIHWNGPVYDFESPLGFIVVNGLCVSNCAAITPNETRAIRGRKPYAFGGDDPLIQGPGGLVPYPMNTGEGMQDIADLIPVMGGQTQQSQPALTHEPDVEEPPSEVASMNPAIEEPNGEPRKFWRYRCPYCNGTKAYNGIPGTNTRFRGSAQCTDCGKGFAAVHRLDLLLEKNCIAKTPGPHKFSSTQFNIADCGYSRSQGSPLDAIKAMAQQIAESDLTGDGRETDYHVTIKYGLHTQNAEQVAALVEGFGPVKITLGKTSIFPAKEATAQRGGDQYDVVKIDVSGNDLVQLNRLISENLECTDTFPDYKPHITLSYVSPGAGEQYAGLDDVDGMEVNCVVLVFSSSEGDKTGIDLTRNRGGAKRKAFDPIKIKLPDLEQSSDFACGASCMMAIGEYFGVGPETEAEWIRLLGTNEDGTSPQAIIQVASDLGLDVHAMQKMTLNQLEAELNAGRPCMLPIQAYSSGGEAEEESGNDSGHWVVAIGMDSDRVIVEDPEIKGSRGDIPLDEFVNRWHDVGADQKPYVRYGISFHRSEFVQPVKAAKANVKIGSFNESDHPRAGDGKFGSGSSGSNSTASGNESTKPSSGAHAKATAAAAKVMDKFKDAYAKIKSAPVLKQVDAAAGHLRSTTKKLYGKLEGRYGKKQALAIMASGQLLDFGSIAAGAAVGIPVWLPGASIWGTLPAVALAEGYLQAKRALGTGKGAESDLATASKQFVTDLLKAYAAYLKSNEGTMRAVIDPKVKPKSCLSGIIRTKSTAKR